MTTHREILKLILAEAHDREREEVLRPLAEAFIAAYDDEVDDEEHAADREILNDTDAHAYYRLRYDRAPGVRPVAPLQERELSETREVCVPAWLERNHRRLLRALAHQERQRDEAALAAMRRELGRQV